jgi:hypothetical protein
MPQKVVMEDERRVKLHQLAVVVFAFALTVGCASAPTGEPTTQFVLSYAAVPGGLLPFATLKDERPQAARMHFHDGTTTVYGDNWLSQPLQDSLRAEVAAQVSVLPNAVVWRTRLASADAAILAFEFSHRRIPDSERLFVVEPTHRVALRLKLRVGDAVYESERTYKTGSDTPQFTNQMQPYFASLVQRLLATIASTPPKPSMERADKVFAFCLPLTSSVELCPSTT